MKSFFLTYSFLLCIGIFTFGENTPTVQKLTVQANKPYGEIQSTMWGIFLEDINFAGDGGMYAELVKNRSFEFETSFMGWTEVNSKNGEKLLTHRGSDNVNNPRFMNLTVTSDTGTFGFSNEGFRGMGVFGNKQYNFSILAQNKSDKKAVLKIQLLTSKNVLLGEAIIDNIQGEWKHYSVSFTSKATDAKAKLNIVFVGKCSVDIDMVSLFPKDTWKGWSNGLRPDLIQWLADMKPGYIRFPGGCVVEGKDLETRYQWKTTVGKVEDRKVIINRWNQGFKDRLAPDYYLSHGIGFYEYFLLCEDLGAEPLPVVNCGMSCQFNNAEIVPLHLMDSYVQDMLDLVEFANGSVETKWGKVRAEMGHPAPFKMKMLGLGNEQHGMQYFERYALMSKILKEKHPEIAIVAGAGPGPDGERFELSQTELKKNIVDVIDEHFFKEADWYLKSATRYDKYDRKGPKLFVGEYSCKHKANLQREARNNWEAALAEAAFLTGLERNADIISMVSYAPLFAHVDAWQWNPNAIWFDNLKSIATPSYYVQSIFGNNKGTNVVPVLRNNGIIAGNDSIYASSVIDRNTKDVIVKIANVSNKQMTFEISIEGASIDSKPIVYQTLCSPVLSTFNSIDNATAIVPVNKEVKAKGSKVNLVVDGRTFLVVRIPCKKL